MYFYNGKTVTSHHKNSTIMKRKITTFLLLCFLVTQMDAVDPPPVIGMSLKAPEPDNLERFITFMEQELAPNGLNTLVLRVEYNYEFTSYPNLRSESALSKREVKKLVKSARKCGIRLIPQINLLGHQSWHSTMGNLLTEYPHFDENPSVKLPPEGTYKWPNKDGLYCKSYCPLHPDVHQVVFALVDEVLEVFEADAFHAGMDEVFYLGEEECPRCNGKDKAKLFADEVNLIRDHLAENDQELWIWGDRLIDGKTSGLGIWEASGNDTHRSLFMISKDVVICDWHYERADPTAALFVLNGFRVITCPWRNPEVTREQLKMLDTFREQSVEQVRDRYYGFMQTIWSDNDTLLEQYYAEDPEKRMKGQAGSLREIFRHYSSGQ